MALRALRERSGLTIVDLARSAGISQPHLSNLEAGRRNASPDVVRRLAQALRVPITAILTVPDDADGSHGGPGTDAPVGTSKPSPRPAPRRTRSAAPNQKRNLMSAHPPVSFELFPAAPAVHLSARPTIAPTGLTVRRRSLVALALGAAACIASAAPATAETFFTGRCAIREQVGTTDPDTFFRTFQARINGAKDPATRNTQWTWNSYDYKYHVDQQLDVGPHSNEVVKVKKGYRSGLRQTYASPDWHATIDDWVAEPGWKGVRSNVGGTVIEFSAAFDVPRSPDPHCTVSTAWI